MSSNSVVGQASKGIPGQSTLGDIEAGKGFSGGTFGDGFIAQISTGGSPSLMAGTSAYDSLTQAPPPPAAPGAQPTLANATMTALQNQLNQEVQMRASSSLATSGMGRGIGASPTAGTMLLGAA